MNLNELTKHNEQFSTTVGVPSSFKFLLSVTPFPSKSDYLTTTCLITKQTVRWARTKTGVSHSSNQTTMNPVLPHVRHNNLFLLRPEENKETSPYCGNHRRIFPQGVAYGPLIPPSSRIARAVMGNASPYNDTGTRDSNEQKPSLSSKSNVSQQQQSDRPRSNLSALMEQQQQERRERSPAKSNACGPQHRAQSSGPTDVVDEADSASGPSPSMVSNRGSASCLHIPQRAVKSERESSTPPNTLPTSFRPVVRSNSNSQRVSCTDSSSDGKVRR